MAMARSTIWQERAGVFGWKWGRMCGPGTNQVSAPAAEPVEVSDSAAEPPAASVPPAEPPEASAPAEPEASTSEEVAALRERLAEGHMLTASELEVLERASAE